jgi:hypothetical protein
MVGILYAILLFFILTPSIFFTLPYKGNKYTVALVHAIIFGILFHFIHSVSKEGMIFYHDKDCSIPMQDLTKPGRGIFYKNPDRSIQCTGPINVS